MHLHHPLRPAPVLLSLLLLTGCSQAPVNVAGSSYSDAPQHDQQAYQAARPKPVALAAPGGEPRCLIYLEKVEDTRTDKSEMGSVGGRKVAGQDMIGWITSGVTSLQDPAYRVDTVSGADDILLMDVQLLKAYMRSVNTSVATNIVVRVTYKRPDSTQLGQQVYRGVDTSINWANGDGEIARDFQLATADMLENMAPELLRYCKSASQPASVAAAR